MFLEKNYLMIGNTRWHWASKIKEQWKYVHTSPNPIEFKDQDYSQMSWSSVGQVPENIKLCPSNQINLENYEEKFAPGLNKIPTTKCIQEI